MGRFTGLMLDFAGVLTSNMVEVYGQFEKRENLPAGLVLRGWADAWSQD
jgi:putative hydrolase of the HAD superfamily